MAKFVGSALTLSWITAGGTLALDVNYRNWEYTPSIDILDATAGHDTSKTKVVSYKDGQASASGLLDAGSAYTYGTALAEGQVGTLVWRPEGSAAGKYSGTAGFISLGFPHREIYNGLTEWAATWEQNGPRTEGTL